MHHRLTSGITGALGITAAHLIVYALALSMVFPFVWMVSTSLKAESEVFGWPPQLLRWPPDWSNYPAAWEIAPFGRYFLNSMAAYAFSRLRFRGRDALFLVFLATMMIPFQATMIPTFLIL
ncbi:MAG: carbohydrate transporter rane protein 2, family, partial [Armatimonadetes bacterium]|nr:carbohydrate transporter rane protein 2, family [Armatimonadota bacterium]